MDSTSAKLKSQTCPSALDVENKTPHFSTEVFSPHSAWLNRPDYLFTAVVLAVISSASAVCGRVCACAVHYTEMCPAVYKCPTALRPADGGRPGLSARERERD